MLRILARVSFVAVTTVIGNYLGGLMGIVIAAIIATVVVTQTEDVVRVLKQTAAAGPTSAQRVYGLMKALVVNPFFTRFARNATIAVVLSLATMLGNYIAGAIGAIIGAALVVSAGQTRAPASPSGQSLSRPQDTTHPAMGDSDQIAESATQVGVHDTHGTEGPVNSLGDSVSGPPELMS